MKQMFDKRELALSSTSDEGLRIKTYGFKDLHGLLINNEFYVDESIDVLNLRLLEEEKEGLTTIAINLKNKSTIVNLYAHGNVGNISLNYSPDISTYHDYYILNGFLSDLNIISAISSSDGFYIGFNLNLSSIHTLANNSLLIRINPKIIKFENVEKIQYDSYLYDVSVYTQNEV